MLLANKTVEEEKKSEEIHEREVAEEKSRVGFAFVAFFLFRIVRKINFLRE